MVTRRTTQRQFLLRPSKTINQCIKYCVAYAAKQSGVQLHAVVFMSNHYHIILTDIEGTLPLFTETLNRLIAKSLNCYHKRGENFWAGHVQPSHVILADRQDVLNKLTYLLCNPVEAGLVKKGKDWPGLRLFGKMKHKCKRPKFFFRSEEQGGSMPKSLDIALSIPDCLGDTRQAINELCIAVGDRENHIHAKRKKTGKRFLGVTAIMKQNVTDTPLSKDKSSALSPRLACLDKWRRIEILQSLKDFRDAYIQAWQDFKEGSQNVLFPIGTYKMARMKSVRIADAEC